MQLLPQNLRVRTTELMNGTVRNIDRTILPDDLPRSDVDNDQNNQRHHPDSMINVESSVHNGMYRRNQGDGRAKSCSRAFATCGANEQSRLPKSGGFPARLTELNLEQVSYSRIQKRKFDEIVSRSSSENLNPDPPDITNNDAALPIIDLTDDADAGIAFINDEWKAAKILYCMRYLGVPQPRQRSEVPITTSRRPSPGNTQQRQVREEFIPSAEQQAMIESTTKMELEKALVRLRQNMVNMRTNRDVLCWLWEVDRDSQCMRVYDDQINLSGSLEAIEDETREAIAMLQRLHDLEVGSVRQKGREVPESETRKPSEGNFWALEWLRPV